ncbi:MULTISPECIES: flavin reductase family protein [Flavobacteriaceae]|uniref:flavin reductase family protein n=1 Tax=Flavobacteriaceae TaxID=49546 RepID=UPI001491EDDB|nr:MULTISPECIES: flavin reductase family protein [Allomuricauda]MDC6367158.1 flavin reductase family protein [Muricauda sp. AC10]
MTKTVDPSQISQPDLHGILLTAVAPRPICFASTVDKDGNVNLSPFSFFNVFSSNPPILIFSPARSGRDNSMKHSHQNVKEVPEVVINIVNHDMVEQMSLASTAYEKGVNEFIKAGFTQIPSEKVKPPRVGEAPVSFECSVQQVIELAQTPGAGNLILAKVELIHINEKYLTEDTLDTQKLDLVGRMGGSWYIKANGEALFEIPKPITTKGVGVDALPIGVRNSEVLTGNNLGRLGNVEKIPSEDKINELIKHHDLDGMSKKSIHEMAKKLLEEGSTEKALSILLYAEKLEE